jgi:hypothetical protein
VKIQAKIFALTLAGAWLTTVPALALAETAKPVSAASAVALDAYFDGIEKSAPAAALGAEADYRAFAKALSDRAVISFGTFGAEGAGVIARDVVLTLGDKKDAGLKVGELRLYVGGKAAKGDVAIERVDARRLSSFGLESLIEETTNAYTKAIIDGVEGASGSELDADAKTKLQASAAVESYDLAIERLVIDGLVVHAPDKKPAAELGDLGALLRLTASMSRASSARAIVVRGSTAVVSSSAAGTTSRMRLTMPFYGLRGVARGDVEATVMTGLKFSLDGESAPTEGAPAIPVAMEGSVDRYTITDLRLAKLFSYWSRGESPPPKEIDLMSLGVWESRNERYALGGQPLYSLDYARTDLSKFRWFAPTEIRSTVANLTYNIGGLLRFSQSAAPQTGEGAQDLATVISLLDKHGFSTIIASGDFAYDWTPASGAAKMVSKNELKTLGRLDLEMKAGLPTFKEFASLYPKKGEAVDMTKLFALFADADLQGASLTAADAGMLPRMFAFAADMQAAQMGAVPGVVKSDDLRAGAAFSLRSLGAAPTPLAPVYAAIADFVAEGGTINLAVSPAAPIPLALILVPGPNGEDPLTRLNITARRTPP